MVGVQGEIVIGRELEEVFDFVANEENEPRYNPQMRLAEKTSHGPIGIGTSFAAEMTSYGRVMPMTIEFTKFDRPHRLVERVHMEAMDLTGGLTFEPVGNGTRMSWSWDLEPHGALRFLKPVVGAIGRRQERRIWTSLKELLERQAPDRRQQAKGGIGHDNDH